MGGGTTLGLLATTADIGAAPDRSRAEALHAAHAALVADAAAPFGASVQRIGSALLIASPSTAAILEAAVALRRAVERHNLDVPHLSLTVRAAVHAGEPFVDGDRLYGPPIDIAIRLVDAAGVGQVIASDVVRGLAGSDAPAFELLAPLDLAGMALTVYDVGWRAPPPPAPPLPAPIARAAGDPFVGRTEEVTTLEALWAGIAPGPPAMALIGGEPGIGKTRLAIEVARSVYAGGGAVLFGRCDEDPLGSYQPFAEALAPLGGLADAAHEQAASVVALGADETGRQRRFDAACASLAGLAEGRPVLLVLDDLQWADTPTLALLRHLARSYDGGPLLVLGTFRDSDAPRDAAFRRTLADVRRDRKVTTVALEGLADDAIASYVEQVAGVDVAAASGLVRLLREATRGNPFFVGEVVRNLAEAGSLERFLAGATPTPEALDLPDGVRDVVARRLGRLDDTTRHALTVASVLGVEFEVPLLAALAELAENTVLDALDEAIAARLVVEVAATQDRLAFAHALVRTALYESMSSSRRMRLHRRAAELLHESGRRETRMAEVAHHLGMAGPLADPAVTAATAREAGDRAAAVHAADEAARMYSVALDALDRAGEPDLTERCRLLLDLATAQTATAGGRGGHEPAGRAAELARTLGRSDLLAEAALLYAGQFSAPGALDDDAVVLLEEAIAAVSDDALATRALLLARLSWLAYARDPSRCPELAADAVALARASGDDAALAVALYGRYAVLAGPAEVDDKAAAGAEIEALAATTGRAELAVFAAALRLSALFERGEVDAVDREIDALDRLAKAVGVPRYAWVPTAARAFRSLIAGAFDEADRLALHAFTIGQEAGEDSFGTFSMQVLALRREQGRLAELEQAARAFSGPLAGVRANQVAGCWVLAMLGYLEEARERFDELAADDFSSLPVDGSWLLATALLAETSAILGDRDRAEVLYRQLSPFADHIAAVSLLVGSGCVHHHLGLLATALGRIPDAERHHVAALERHTAMRARPWMARSQLALASLLAPSGDARALGMATAARDTATELGMADLVEAAERLVEGRPEGVEPPEAVPVARPDDSGGLLLKEGEFWTVALDTELVRLKDSKGLRYLAHLLTRPGMEVHVLDLVGAVDGGGGPPVFEADTGPVLDAQAKEAYRERIRDLQEDLDDAEAAADVERAARARLEIDFIIEELARAVGLGGRDRRAGSAAERARQNVSRAIKAAIERLAAGAPALGRHLTAAVRTGIYCSYALDPRAALQWRTGRAADTASSSSAASDVSASQDPMQGSRRTRPGRR